MLSMTKVSHSSISNLLTHGFCCLKRNSSFAVVGETLHQQNNVPLLPTVTSFIQALPSGEPFRVSIHAWKNPEPSRYAHNVTKEPDLVMFEARVLVDGRLVGQVVSSLVAFFNYSLIRIIGRKSLLVMVHGPQLSKQVSVRATASRCEFLNSLLASIDGSMDRTF
jgi:hypothetical protein